MLASLIFVLAQLIFMISSLKRVLHNFINYFCSIYYSFFLSFYSFVVSFLGKTRILTEEGHRGRNMHFTRERNNKRIEQKESTVDRTKVINKIITNYF